MGTHSDLPADAKRQLLQAGVVPLSSRHQPPTRYSGRSTILMPLGHKKPLTRRATQEFGFL